MTRLRFLLLEDSLLDAELTQAMLVEGGLDCELVRVETRADFLAALENAAFDLILADYSLPSFDGISALEIAHSLCPEVPFIFVSATLGEELAIEALKSGATDYVLKQRLGRLVPSVQRALREAKERFARQQAEAELFRREQEFRALVENSPDIIARFDRTLKPLYVNPALEVATGISPKQFLRKTHAELGFPEDIYTLWQLTMRQVLATGEGNFVEFNFPSADRTRYYQARVVPELALDGSVQSLLWISRDVTEYKQAEQALRTSEAQLRQQAEALEQASRVKDEFLAVLSHELRSPLNAILGWSKMLRYRKFSEETTSRALETIERNAQLQTRLIEDLLDVSRIIQGKLSLSICPVNLISVIEAAINTMRLAAEAKSIQILFLLDSSIGLVSGDPNRLQQVVWNLLSNSIKFTPPGGQIQIKLEAIDSQAQIQVSDSGKGIPTNFLPYVFEYFRQADGSTTRNYGGLGLGLAIVRHLVELHGGTVAAESLGEEQGATFTVRLPLMLTQPEKPDRDGALDNALRLDGVHILVVDDEIDSAEVVAFVLEQSGAIVLAVDSAKEAIAALTTFKPDVLVSDIGMPEVDGYAFLRQLRAIAPEPINQIPAIALTAYAREEDRQQALNAGFQTHMAKPINPTELVTMIANLVRRQINSLVT